MGYGVRIGEIEAQGGIWDQVWGNWGIGVRFGVKFGRKGGTEVGFGVRIGEMWHSGGIWCQVLRNSGIGI